MEPRLVLPWVTLPSSTLCLNWHSAASTASAALGFHPVLTWPQNQPRTLLVLSQDGIAGLSLRVFHHEFIIQAANWERQCVLTPMGAKRCSGSEVVPANFSHQVVQQKLADLPLKAPHYGDLELLNQEGAEKSLINPGFIYIVPCRPDCLSTTVNQSYSSWRLYCLLDPSGCSQTPFPGS